MGAVWTGDWIAWLAVQSSTKLTRLPVWAALDPHREEDGQGGQEQGWVRRRWWRPSAAMGAARGPASTRGASGQGRDRRCRTVPREGDRSGEGAVLRRGYDKSVEARRLVLARRRAAARRGGRRWLRWGRCGGLGRPAVMDAVNPRRRRLSRTRQPGDGESARLF